MISAGTIATSRDTANGTPAASLNGKLSGKNASGTGYRYQALSTPIPANTSVNISLRYRKTWPAIAPNPQTMSVQISSDNTNWTTVWDNTNVVQMASFTAGSRSGVNVGTSAIPYVRLWFDIAQGNNNSALTDEWFDNVSITYTTPYGAIPSFAPPRATGGTTAIACNSCHQFAPDDNTVGYKSVDGYNQYYYAQPGSHAAHGQWRDFSGDRRPRRCRQCG